MQTIQPLPLKRRYAGLNWDQVVRGKKWVIYKMEGQEHYEVVKVRLKDASVMGVQRGNFKRSPFTHREAYPHTESWGKMGFSYISKKEAVEKFNEVSKGV